MNAEPCPPDQQWQDFQLGDLAEPRLSDLARHLEQCPRCETVVQQFDTKLDGIMSALRRPATTAIVTRPNLHRLPATQPAADYPFLLPPRSTDELGRLGDYRVLRLLGRGGMAFVFQAEDVSLRRQVALKVLKPDLADDPEGWLRFVREGRIMAAIKHEHLVTVYQVGRENGVVFLAMELLEGEALGAWLDRVGTAPVGEALRLAREITSGLAVVHRHGLLHRDVKPDNIWLEAPGGKVKILDFGLARSVKDEVRLTTPGLIMGTPSFMSPEQARGLAVDERSDLFSLGGVLYSLCAGRKPFPAETTMAVLTALAVDTPPAVHEINPTIPRALSELIMQLLDKNPQRRPASADEVLERLNAIVPGQAAPGRPKTPRKLVAIAIGLLLLAGVCYLGFNGFSLPSNGSRLAAYPFVPDATYLTTLEVEDAKEWPFPGPLPPGPPRDDEPREWPEPAGGHRVYVKDRASPHGIWMHLPPDRSGEVSIRYRLGKKFARFETQVTLNDGPPWCIPLTFTVVGDGKVLWESKPVSRQADLQSCSISVQGVDVFEIRLTGTGDERGTHGVWIEPHFKR